MKILYVSNYPSWERISIGDQASHHMFGIYQRVQKWEIKKGAYRAILKDGLGIVDFVICKSKKDQVKVWLKSLKYDIVYDVLNCTKQTSSLIHYFSPSKLVSILHHPPYDKQLKFGRSDAYVFFCNAHRELAINFKPSLKDIMFVNEWHPDVEWYKSHLEFAGQTCKYTIVDNGRTNRDHEFLVKAIKEAKTTAFIFDKNLTGEPGLYDVPEDILDEMEVMDILLNSKCIAIPLKEKLIPYGPIAATVLMDAMALGKPVICSDNFYMADQVAKNKIGLVYKTGDNESLVYCLKCIQNDEKIVNELSNNMRCFCEQSSLQIYSDNIFKVFNSLLK